jgi:hypothetical protein
MKLALSHEEQAVLSAFRAAVAAGQRPAACYRAGVAAWRELHPDQDPAYSARRAVAIMLAARAAAMASPKGASIPSSFEA